MPGIFDYLKWRGDLPFDCAPINEVDALIFCELSFVDLNGIVTASVLETDAPNLLTVARNYFRDEEKPRKQIGLIVPGDILTLLREAALCERYRHVLVTGFTDLIDEEKQEQFSATTFLFGSDAAFIAFRGTDDTLVGWKENFNMSFQMPVPAQIDSAAYLEKVAQALPHRRLYVGGHSKGGNLAVYSSMNVSREIQNRIVRVYNNDGPGFMNDFSKTEPYLAIADRVVTIVPESSIVGMLLNHSDEYTVVKSTSTGLRQHDGFCWQVMGGSFEVAKERSKTGLRTEDNLQKWIGGLSTGQREIISNGLFEILTSSDARTLTDLAKKPANLVKFLRESDPETRKLMSETLKQLVMIWGKSIFKFEETE